MGCGESDGAIMTDQTPANVIPFDGFKPIDGNFTQVPNQVFELMPTLSGSELKCLLYIVRHTLGFQDKVKTITIDEFEHGRKLKTGQRMDDGVGMGRETIVNALKSLAERAIITRDLDARDKARQKITYGLHQSDNPTSDNQSEKLTATVGKSDRKNRKIRPRSEKHTLEDKPQIEKIVAATPPTLAIEPKAEKKSPLRSEGKPYPVYDALESRGWGIPFNDTAPRMWTQPIGIIAKWLTCEVWTFQKQPIGKNETPATAEDVFAFYDWWARNNPKATPPRNVFKFIEHWREWKAAVAKSTASGLHIFKSAEAS
jgi:phage replication O-like protein O